jgi:hypothetical protein
MAIGVFKHERRSESSGPSLKYWTGALMSERRRHTRGEVRAEIEYRGSSGLSHATIADISIGGMRLVLAGPEVPGNAVHVRVRFASELAAASFESDARVVWARQRAPFLTGIRWVQPDASRDDLIDQSVRLGQHLHN